MSAMDIFEKNKSADVNIMFNVSAIYDCWSARWVKGTRGDYIQLGGYSGNSGIAAPANCGKTEQALLMFSRVMKRIPCATGQIYESEGTLDIERVNEVLRRDPNDTDGYIRQLSSLSALAENPDLIDDGITFIDGQLLSLDRYSDALHQFSEERAKLRKSAKNMVTLPFLYHAQYKDKILPPCLPVVDSGSEASIGSSEVKLEDKGVDDPASNMTDMSAGKVKTRIFQRLGHLGPKGDVYVLSTASIDKKADMNTMPGMSPPKEMTHMVPGEAIKGVGTSYKKRTSILWAMNKATTLFKATGNANKYPKYPRNKEDNYLGNMDLQCNVLTTLRNKCGPSGFAAPIVRSQMDGILEVPTFFESIKKNGRDDNFEMFGLTVPKQYHFALDLLPEIHFRMTNLREIAESNPLFFRALELTYRLKMLFHISPIPKFRTLRCTPSELYEGIKEAGYKWPIILNTRSWYTVLEEEHRFRPQLTEVDIIRMWKEKYVPHWMQNEKGK